MKNLTSGTGGRPPEAQLSPFLVQLVLRFYVGFLRTKAPKNWNDRSINFALFSPEVAKTEQKNRSPYNGIAALLKRKSLPSLGQGDRVSRAIFLAEKTEDFVGGVQVLFHAYVVLLHFPTDIDIVRDLLFNCGASFSLGFARRTPFGDTRSQRSAQEEVLALEIQIARLRTHTDTWQCAFPDLVGTALALTIESYLIRDSERLRIWKEWWNRASLRFEDWPMGDLAARTTMDRYLSQRVNHLELPYSDPLLNGYKYLLQHVIASDKNFQVNVADDPDQSLSRINFSNQELASIFLSLRDGIRPNEKDVQAILLGSRNSSGIF